MSILGEEIKSSNLSRVTIIFIIAIIWRIYMGDTIQPKIRDPYIFPIIGFFMVAIICGELTRRLFRVFFKKGKKHHKKQKYILPEEALKTRESQGDIEALNFAIFWSFLWMMMAIYFQN